MEKKKIGRESAACGGEEKNAIGSYEAERREDWEGKRQKGKTLLFS